MGGGGGAGGPLGRRDAVGTTRQRNHTALRKSSAKNSPAPEEGAPSLAKFSLHREIPLAASPEGGTGGSPSRCGAGRGGGLTRGCRVGLLCRGAGGGCVHASPGALWLR